MRPAAQLNLCDVAILQHEYGVYGGADGSEILHLLDEVQVPSVVVLHTVLTDPTPHQRQVLESVLAKADAVVAMTMTARERLAAGYVVDMTKGTSPRSASARPSSARARSGPSSRGSCRYPSRTPRRPAGTGITCVPS